MKWTGRLIWDCKIGIDEIGELESGADYPMREIISAGFLAVVGRHPKFIFSGWNATLTDTQKEIVDNEEVL